jgi:hypothetical protein
MSLVILPVLYVFVSAYCLVPMAFISSLIGLINPLLRKYKLKGDNPSVEHGLGDFIRDTFFYKKTFIIFLAAYNLMMSTGLYLNSSYTASCFVGILILALYFEMFQTKMPEDPTQLDGFENIGKYFNFKKEEGGKFVCPDKNVSITTKVVEVKKDIEITNSNASELNVNPQSNTNSNKVPYIQKPFSTSQYIEPPSGNNQVPEETMNPLQQGRLKQSGGSKVRTKTGKIRQKYNVSLI